MKRQQYLLCFKSVCGLCRTLPCLTTLLLHVLLDYSPATLTAQWLVVQARFLVQC